MMLLRPHPHPHSAEYTKQQTMAPGQHTLCVWESEWETVGPRGYSIHISLHTLGLYPVKRTHTGGKWGIFKNRDFCISHLGCRVQPPSQGFQCSTDRFWQLVWGGPVLAYSPSVQPPLPNTARHHLTFLNLIRMTDDKQNHWFASSSPVNLSDSVLSILGKKGQLLKPNKSETFRLKSSFFVPGVNHRPRFFLPILCSPTWQCCNYLKWVQEMQKLFLDEVENSIKQSE